jgi:cell division protein FtsB
MSASTLAQQLEAELQRVSELQERVQVEERNLERMRATQHTLEINMSKLYETAKTKIALLECSSRSEATDQHGVTRR